MLFFDILDVVLEKKMKNIGNIKAAKERGSSNTIFHSKL
jgi:hypothetical protein